nr:immunoglobulin light chain junction region [Macaca mulatta]MOX74710.1 immunoglobulin light chain junction region [Macaca mulatta]
DFYCQSYDVSLSSYIF